MAVESFIFRARISSLRGLLGDYASDEEEVVDELKDKPGCWRVNTCKFQYDDWQLFSQHEGSVLVVRLGRHCVEGSI